MDCGRSQPIAVDLSKVAPGYRHAITAAAMSSQLLTRTVASGGNGVLSAVVYQPDPCTTTSWSGFTDHVVGQV